ncbi:hypothetical protein GOP47_0003917 [Adiantum capillus-veneris]|uniref:Cytochrome b5 heme-binding domain-containing protein n=1 Tax=Adiantum capillus-veneris TaxID=13818 RepID=A0A9D4V723_ADICA|nr:hypothetical protein GOP47_0003917 [Adiantum capillus-veneris]
MAKSPRQANDERAPACLGLSIAFCLVAIVLYLASERTTPPRLWTREELTMYNGTDKELPILLGILGNVFDVTKGKTHYGAGGSYNHFAGRDATRAFVSGNFSGDGLTDSVAGLSNMEIKSLLDKSKREIAKYDDVAVCTVLTRRVLQQQTGYALMD